MRTISDSASVRLYHLDDESAIATTIVYGALSDALAAAAEQDDAVQDGLFLQTGNDVVAYRDLVGG